MNKPDEHELTKTDLDIFKKEFLKWVDIFGLRGWRLFFRLKELDGAYGTCSTNLVGRVATITLNNTMEREEYSDGQVKKTAFHECCELFLTRIKILAEYRHTTADEITEEIHNIIRTMEYIKEKH